jgi:hypothetical protein
LPAFRAPRKLSHELFAQVGFKLQSSRVTRITGVSHWCPTCLPVLGWAGLEWKHILFVPFYLVENFGAQNGCLTLCPCCLEAKWARGRQVFPWGPASGSSCGPMVGSSCPLCSEPRPVLRASHHLHLMLSAFQRTLHLVSQAGAVLLHLTNEQTEASTGPQHWVKGRTRNQTLIFCTRDSRDKPVYLFTCLV